MELFTGRIGLRLLKSPSRYTNNFQNQFFGYQKRFRLPQGSKLGVTLFEKTHNRLSFVNRISITENSNGRNLRPLFRLYSDESKKDTDVGQAAVKKPNIFQRMKQMTKDYWHILVPVHVVTSVGWMLIFYTAAKNSVDVIWIMEKLHFSEKYIDALRGSSAGFWAVAYALYKICTPIRYTVTVGGTTLSIRYLNRMGYLKKNPRSTAQHKETPGKLGSKDGQRQSDPPKT